MWYKFSDDSMHFKVHYINMQLKEQLLAHLKKENPRSSPNQEYSEDNATDAFFEPGGYGMYANGQPRFTVDALGKTLTVDCAKAEELLTEVANGEWKQFADGTEYMIIYSRFYCLIFSRAEREQII